MAYKKTVYEIINSDDLHTIGERTEAIRRLERKSVTKFCEIIGASRHLYNKAKISKYPFYAEWVLRISETFKVNFNWLYYGKGEIYIKNLGDENA
ncbi:hypothetical protein ACHJH3_08595 [Campylobacter sp. MOP7]|uniref:hypothetical protein n=1 Tax=Campylobacter canis TaxID=3378588 RepID=UPI00387E9569